MKKQLTFEKISLLAILILAFCLRFYKLDQFLFFGFEQGRDAFRIQSLISFSDLIIVGPKTDIAGIFHGPWYYYLMTIPYFLSRGNPMGAILFLNLLSVAAIIPFYLLIKKQVSHKNSALLGAFLGAISYRFIEYGRWLSNVSPAIFFLSLSLYFLWSFREKKKPLLFYIGIFLLGMAAQFQIILTGWAVVFIGLLFLLKVLPLKKFTLKESIVSLGAFSVPYLPLLAFNLKYNFITLRSSFSYLTGSSEIDSTQGGIIQNVAAYIKMLSQEFYYSLPLTPQFLTLLLFVSLLILLIWILWRESKKSFRKSQLHVQAILFWLSLIFMTLPALFFAHFVGLIQIYVGIGFGLVALLVLVFDQIYDLPLKRFWKISFYALLSVMSVLSIQKTIFNLQHNHQMFFRTIQDDLNLRDQKAVLAYISQNARNKYYLKALTIPYYQEEGWLYLHQVKVGHELEPGADQIFVVIEEKVDPYWEEQWLDDLGETKLIEEKKFGLIRVQQRQRI